MSTPDFTTSFLVDQSPAEVFDAVNNVCGWWTENVEGSTQHLNDEFEVHFFVDVHYSKQKLIEVIPNEKVVWLVTDSRLNFLKDKSEWTGTKISFDITQQDGKTKLLFTHHGLVPGIECYKDCSPAWLHYIKSLQQLVTIGKGQPEPLEEKRA